MSFTGRSIRPSGTAALRGTSSRWATRIALISTPRMNRPSSPQSAVPLAGAAAGNDVDSLDVTRRQGRKIDK